MTRALAVALAGLIAAAVTVSAQSGAIPKKPDDRTIAHVLNRIAYGPSPGDVERVKRLGLARYIEQQLEVAAPASTPIDPAAEVNALAQQKLRRAVESERQLEEILVDFWFNHFNVFAGKGATRLFVAAYEQDVIRPRVFGRFRDLLGAVAESPAMLFYLDNWQSAAPRVEMAGNRRGRGLNENYARELLELHTLGVDGGYTQRDIEHVARAFTGWTLINPRQGGGFAFTPRLHDEAPKVVLGTRIDAGGKRDGERVLDILAAHPATARLIATKLARRFVADDPPPALVERAARVFERTDGDLRAVVRAIVTSPEFFAATRSKIKTPFEFVASALRASGSSPADLQPFVQALRQLGMPPYGCQPPTGYADRAEAWINTGALLERMNVASAVARLDARTPDAARDLALTLGSPDFQKR